MKIYNKDAMVPKEEPSHQFKKKTSPKLYIFLMVFVVLNLLGIVIVTNMYFQNELKEKGIIEEKKRDSIISNFKNMRLEELVVMKNGNILVKEVEYKNSEQTNPSDTSKVFFEVIRGNEEYEKGDLVKFNHRYRDLQQLDGEEFCILDPKQVQFLIKKQDVKRDILKR